MKRIFLMKKLLVLLFLLLPLMVQAQTFFRCTGDNVNVRRGPGKNYKNVPAQGQVLEYAPYQLEKNSIVKYLGKRQNGFMYVGFVDFADMNSHYFFDKGWVSSQFLKPCSKCADCGGKGTWGVCRVPDCSHDVWFSPCAGTGKNFCENCHGLGYR